jgi:integrase
MFDIGGIYSDQRCPFPDCGNTYVDDKKSSLRCPDHPWHIASTFKVRLRGTTSRFWDYFTAKRYLEALRKAVADGTWSGVKSRDLGTVMGKFLEWKRELADMGRLKSGSIATYDARLRRIVFSIGVSKDASEVTYRDVHRFLYKDNEDGKRFAPKTLYDSYTVFKEMMGWALDMEYITKIPKWPLFHFSLEHDMTRRKTVSKDTQERILHDIYLLEWESRPRLYLAVRFLATYINLRPSELLWVKERDFKRKQGLLVITQHKTGPGPKIVRLTEKDISLLNELPRGMPGMPLFRYDVPCGNIKAGTGFGQAAFYRAWKRSCKNLGVEGVDLYGGTRHSSAIALYKDAGISPEEIKKATGHKTSVAFTRYFKLDIDDVLEIHTKAAPETPKENFRDHRGCKLSLSDRLSGY